MIPAAFAYERPTTLEEALDLLGEHGEEAKLLAGGHSLLPLMKLRLAAPGLIVDLGWLHELSYVRDRGEEIAIGATTTHHRVEIDALVGAHLGVLAAVAGQVGDPQVRHRGTIGGSVAHGDPASDLPATLLALEASYVLSSRSGERIVPAAGFHSGFLETALRPDEILTEIRVRKTTGSRHSFQKFNRRAQDWAIVGAVVVQNGSARIALINMGSVPLRAPTSQHQLL
jgi:carbon-monoxide dehydrogenase medium subunit